GAEEGGGGGRLEGTGERGEWERERAQPRWLDEGARPASPPREKIDERGIEGVERLPAHAAGEHGEVVEARIGEQRDPEEGAVPPVGREPELPERGEEEGAADQQARADAKRAGRSGRRDGAGLRQHRP